MDDLFDKTNLDDIDYCRGKIRKKSNEMKTGTDDIKSRGNCSFQIDRKKNLTKEKEGAVSIAIDGLNSGLE